MLFEGVLSGKGYIMPQLKNYVSIDIETTGLNPKTDRIIEVGAVRVYDGKICEIKNWLINPRCELSDFIKDLTKIDEAMLEDAPYIEETLPEVIEFCKDDVLLGHNIMMDFSFLKRNAVNRKFTFEKYGIDTLKLARVIFADMEKKNLGFLCDKLGIAAENKHRAADDALATVELFWKMEEAAKGREEWEKLFKPVKLQYSVKKEGPITPAQKSHIKKLLDGHGLILDRDIDSMTKNEASRYIDKTINKYGRVKV